MRVFIKQIVLAPFWLLMGDFSWIGALQSGKNTDATIRSNEGLTDKALAEQRLARQQQQNNFEGVQQQFAPYRNVGESAVKPFQDLLSGNYNVEASPSGKYALQQGSRAINSSLQARGLEGNAVQQLGQLHSGVAATDYQNRFSNLLSALNVGTSAAAGQGSAAGQMNANIQSGANASGGLMSNLAGLNSAAMQNNQSAIGAAAGNMSGTGSTLLGNYLKSRTTPDYTSSSYSGGVGSSGGYSEGDANSVGPSQYG